ncbi:metallophosphoesterase 1 homolog [Phlebotomus papatasi]|uniref:metallophosphoesterase 1 homolog n=1 Tax=Phlebotomus papatasi TaxID=29031 RepID=UPI0024832F98|nr:metallophosphoesterase 1 homolog [Phlebotomus papatasi]
MGEGNARRKMKFRRFLTKLGVSLFCLLFFCEYVFYYIVISQCSWPDIQKNDQNPPLKVMLLADTHLLGPYRGHWFDKLRREWQMYRSFQTAVELFRPEAVFILGDLFDEGKWVTDPEFSNYVERYQNLFSVPDSTKLIGIVGNHDIGFHYEARQRLTRRFEENFHTTGVSLLTLRDIHFVLVNSIAMEGDGCNLCSEAESQLRNISRIFRCSRNIGNCKDVPTLSSYSKPILLQHYPLYRESDRDCQEHDPIPLELYRERWEVLSQESSDLIGELISPRIAFSGHSHNYCRLVNRLGIMEYTISSFSWRNKNNPNFLLAAFTPTEQAVHKCNMPRESTVMTMYAVGGLLAIILATIQWNCANILNRRHTKIF